MKFLKLHCKNRYQQEVVNKSILNLVTLYCIDCIGSIQPLGTVLRAHANKDDQNQPNVENPEKSLINAL